MNNKSCESSSATAGDVKGTGYSGRDRRGLFVLEAKLGPNEWCLAAEVYPHARLNSYYSNDDEAKKAKADLKTKLLGPWKGRYRKKPIRVRKM